MADDLLRKLTELEKHLEWQAKDQIGAYALKWQGLFNLAKSEMEHVGTKSEWALQGEQLVQVVSERSLEEKTSVLAEAIARLCERADALQTMPHRTPSHDQGMEL